MAPSPSTRARAPTWSVRLGEPRWLMGLCLLGELVAGGVEGAEDQTDVALRDAVVGEPPGERRGVEGLLGAEAPVTASVYRGAQRPAASMGHRAQAWRAPGDHDAHVAAQLALDADAVRANGRPASGEKGADHFEELAPVDGTTAKLEVHRDVGGDRGGVLESGDVLGSGVDDRCELFNVREVPKRLDAPR